MREGLLRAIRGRARPRDGSRAPPMCGPAGLGLPLPPQRRTAAGGGARPSGPVTSPREGGALLGAGRVRSRPAPRPACGRGLATPPAHARGGGPEGGHVYRKGLGGARAAA